MWWFPPGASITELRPSADCKPWQGSSPRPSALVDRSHWPRFRQNLWVTSTARPRIPHTEVHEYTFRGIANPSRARNDNRNIGHLRHWSGVYVGTIANIRRYQAQELHRRIRNRRRNLIRILRRPKQIKCDHESRARTSCAPSVNRVGFSSTKLAWPPRPAVISPISQRGNTLRRCRCVCHPRLTPNRWNGTQVADKGLAVGSRMCCLVIVLIAEAVTVL